MPRLIDADALAKWLDKEHYVDRPSGKCDERQNRVLGIAISALKNPQIAPTIDAEPVRHGRWGETQVIGYDGIHPVYGKPCSKCGYETELYKPNYCPNCGAKMDGGKDNDCE